MFARPLVVALAASVLACSPLRPEPTPARTWSVDPAALVRSYQDYSDRWTGQRVTVQLAAKDYTVSGHELHWHLDRKSDPPTMVFVFAGVPVPDNTRPIEVTGVCAGMVFDKRHRGNGQQWHVRVEQCTAVIR